MAEGNTMKKSIVFIIVVMLGSAATLVIDSLLGVSMAEHFTNWQAIGHNLVWFAQGAAIALVLNHDFPNKPISRS